MNKVLVTGVDGFVGKHLAKELFANGYIVDGVGISDIGASNKIKELNSYMLINLMKRSALKKIDFNAYNFIIHLAGLAAVGPSFEEPLHYITTNVGIEINLYEETRSQNAKPKFLIISSGSIYDHSSDLPISESSELLPGSPYAVSKISQEQMAHYYSQLGFVTILARPFNHIGPGQNLGFIVPDITKQVVDIEKGERSTVLTGNLNAKRDYTDVRDIVRAYRLLIERGLPGETYNICSSIPTSGEVILNKIISLSDKKISYENDPVKSRPSDYPIIYGSYEKIKKDTGWMPEISLDKTLLDVLTDWRNR